MILLNEKRAKDTQFAQPRYTRGTRIADTELKLSKNSDVDVPVAPEQDLVVSDASAPTPMPQRLVDHAAVAALFSRQSVQARKCYAEWRNDLRVPICEMSLTLVSVVTRIYAPRSSGPRWENRLPRCGDFSLDTSKRDAQAFQVIMLCVMRLLPAFGVVHFQTTFVDGTIREVPNDCAVSQARSCGHVFSGWQEMFFKRRQATAGASLKYDPNKEIKHRPRFNSTLGAMGLSRHHGDGVGFRDLGLGGDFSR
jgi:hypothetical protein